LLAELTLIDWLGVVGSVIIAGAYLVVSRGLVDPRRPVFNLMNLAGAVLILVSLYYRPNAGAILIEVLWVGIAIYALVSYIAGRR